MKKFILSIVIIAFFICPSVCLSSYLIKLKNGSTFITNHYWKEGRQIKFYCRGGVVGISRNLIRKIEETDLVYKENVVFPEKKPEAAPGKAKHEIDAKTEETPASGATVKKDDLFIKEFNVLKQRFENIESTPTPELYEFSKDLTNFRDKIHKSRLGHVYVNQIFEIHAMGDEIEAAIKRRGQ
ncbi:MAG: hypothetical protein SRB1_02887 [Desulfobacteraceae bacterium Eth-SRB1]|nr:MAG: hypothetical protein SRB1_02887 [Desulfobacteraceae bacterium Eth-SRB1]